MSCSNGNNNSVRSACALRKILNCLDCLNRQDLETLDDIVDRILHSHDDNDCDC